MLLLRKFPGLLVFLLLTACGEPQTTGPVEVHWDRDACERCRMVLSDHKHAAQVRYFLDVPKGSKVIKFDDIGCALVWLEDKPWRDDPKTEIWVADRESGDWLNARKAFYIKGDTTPMEYGIGAVQQASGKTLTFDQAKSHIFEIEQKYNQHADHLVERLRAQAQQHKETHQSKQ